MGSNNLVKYLLDSGDKCQFIAAISAGNPWDLLGLWQSHEKKNRITRLMYELYHKGALFALKRKVKNNRAIFEGFPNLDIENVLKASSLMEFSDRFSKIIYGYNSVEEYYHKGSCTNFIGEGKIPIPLLCLNADDDPLVPLSSIPLKALCTHQNTIVAITKGGGHLAWLDYRGRCWMNTICMQFLISVLSLHNSKKLN